MCVLLWNGLRLRVGEETVEIDGRDADMTRMEQKLLLFLLGHPDADLSRERLLLEVWGYDMPGITRTVDTHIKKLRAHLGAAGGRIQTVRGVGYRLAGQPEWVCCQRCA